MNRCSKCGKAITKAAPMHRPRRRSPFAGTRKAWVTILTANARCPEGGAHEPGKGS